MKSAKADSLSIIIPVYNERRTISTILTRVKRADSLGLKKEIIVVDDGSTDGTREILHRYSRSAIKIIFHPTNRGKGAAVRSGLRAAAGEIILIQDADLEYDPRDYPALLLPLINGNAKVVYGSRLISGKNRYSSLFFFAGGMAVNLLTNLLYGYQITDVNTGYKVCKGKVLRALPLRSTGFEFCAEVTARLLNQRVPILEVPIRYSPRSKAMGKKIRAVDGFKAMLTLVWYRCFPAGKRRGMRREAFTQTKGTLLDDIIEELRFRRVIPHIPRQCDLVDLGCGYRGKLLCRVAPTLRSGRGYDLGVVEQHPRPNLTLSSADLNRKLPLPDSTADVVIALAVIEHLDKPRTFLREIRRILKPNGLVLLTTPSNRAKWCLERLAAMKAISREEIGDHKRYYTQRSLQEELLAGGFPLTGVAVRPFELGMNLFATARK